jgi:23S rRNA pseudouridine1911/1915/1917 synthase
VISLREGALGRRLDVALQAALEAQGHPLSRSQLAKVFAEGGVVVAGRPGRPGRVVEGPLEVEVSLPEPVVLVPEPEAIPLAVLWEDDDVLVVDKPAHRVVHAGPGHPRGTLVNAVLHHLGVSAAALPVLPGNDTTRPGIVHRLDRDTSGVMVIAKTEPALRDLHRQFREHRILRRYLGVVEGVPVPAVRRIETPHARDPHDRRRFSSKGPGRRMAITHVEVEQAFGDAALVAFRLETGRTHQIRMHAAESGHPVLGDELYGRVPSALRLRALVAGLGRQALHAEWLGFSHPKTGEVVRFQAPLPQELATFVSRIGEPRASG